MKQSYSVPSCHFVAGGKEQTGTDPSSQISSQIITACADMIGLLVSESQGSREEHGGREKKHSTPGTMENKRTASPTSLGFQRSVWQIKQLLVQLISHSIHTEEVMDSPQSA